MFLIRTAFWLGLIVMLLPNEQQQQAQLYKQVSESAHRVATFCDRNEGLCAQGSVYWAAFRKKLEFGAKLAFDVASERLFGVTQAPTASTVASTGNRPHGTLQPADLVPAWRG